MNKKGETNPLVSIGFPAVIFLVGVVLCFIGHPWFGTLAILGSILIYALFR